MNEATKSCDVIIPTYNNAAVLPTTLAALFEQSTDPAWRIRLILSDDGSQDNTVAVAQAWRERAPWPLTILTNDHRGAAHARNRALDVSQSHIILFLGADIVLRPKALFAHTDFHDHFTAEHDAALGHVAWDPRLSPTPFMEWMVHGGPQNDFDVLLGQTEADARHFF